MTKLTHIMHGAALTVLAFATAAEARVTLVPVPSLVPVLAPIVAPTPKPAHLAKPYYGTIDPFYGTIDPFWGTINPFYGTIDPFWGTINPFSGDVAPMYGTINPFWGTINPFAGNIDPYTGIAPLDYTKVGNFWRDFGPIRNNANQQWGAVGSYANNPTGYWELQTTLNNLVTHSEVMWGTAVTARTGKSFRTGFADGIFAKYGVNLDNMATFEALSASQRAQFFLAWYDGLMDYSGRDHVDHWMGAVNWSPDITKTQGRGTGTTIGLLDSTVVNDRDIANNVLYTLGYNNPLGGHGTGVASLMVAEHDGRGLMGIAPNATVAAHNPFDASGTASWADIRSGVKNLGALGASVINMSLGVPGWTLHPDWKQVFADPGVAVLTSNTVFVVAAGNEGKAQLTNIAWDWATDPHLIVVGSVSPNGAVSSFSNTPGTACLLNNGVCYEANRLWNRFIVAPGEAILMSDGLGGLTRRSGTSFAAPLVSGTIALLHDRWPWLAKHPDETVEIILRSAKDLGTPGPDQVYGWGLLNVKASQSPLNFSNLVYYMSENGMMKRKSTATIRSTGVQPSWEADGVYFSLFEYIGDTRRDFVVPMSSRLVGQKTSAGGSNEYFQSYLTSRFTDWIRTGNYTGLSDMQAVDLAPIGNLDLTFSASPLRPSANGSSLVGAPHSMIRISDRTHGLSMTAGYGQGALALNGERGFGLTSDHDSSEGGVNPVLGFASGGAFASVGYKVAPGWTLSSGFTNNRLVHSNLAGLNQADRRALIDLAPYQAEAFNIALTHDVNASLSIGASYTRLDEQAALLGVQSIEPGDLGNGSATEAMTLSANAKLGKGIAFSVSATAAKTRADDQGQAFTTDDNGVLSSAFAVAAAKTGIVGKRDQLRLSIAQPLHVERGEVKFTSIQVIDRSTGDIGAVTQRFDIAGQERRLIGEMLYATPLFDTGSELSLFGRAQMRAGSKTKLDDYIAGARVRISF